MQHLVDDMLHMVKVELGKLEVTLDKRHVDLARLVANVVQTNRMIAAKKHMTIEYSILNWKEQGTATPWEIVESNTTSSYRFLVDPLRIEQVVNNLLSNAIKFSYPGSKIEVFGEKKDSEGLVEITVKDNGKGIPTTDMEQLFTAFSRLSVKPTAGESSNGLGLCIVKSIVEAHRGNIFVESTVGKGTSFRVSLPGKATPTPIRRASTDIAKRLDVVSKEKQLRILLADDNTVNQHLVSQVLSKRGHSVVVAGDGLEALRIFEREGEHEGFDVLLVDEEMPHMNGRQVIEKIRSKENLTEKHIPIIAVSGHVTPEYYEDMKKIGADEFVPKPFRIQSLISKVEQYTLSSEPCERTCSN
jgi:CheY-like chemotaxis protein